MSKILAVLCSVVAAGYFLVTSSYADEAKKVFAAKTGCMKCHEK